MFASNETNMELTSKMHKLLIQGAMAARAQEGLEELSHIEGQEGRQWGDTPRPR